METKMFYKNSFFCFSSMMPPPTDHTPQDPPPREPSPNESTPTVGTTTEHCERSAGQVSLQVMLYGRNQSAESEGGSDRSD